MSSQTIPNLPIATALGGNELIWAIQNGTDVQLTVTQVISFFNSPASIGQLVTVYMLTLPTTLPLSAGQLWNNKGVISLSGPSFGNDIGQLVTAYMITLPTTLPLSAGQLWNNGGVISLS